MSRLSKIADSRIAALPRRNWESEPLSATRVREVTALVRTRVGCQRLFPIQAASLIEAFECGGLFCAAQVGAGKTLTSGLLPLVLGAVRPMLVVPASLVEKTQLEFEQLRLHWQIPRNIRIVSYTALGLEKNATLLHAYSPDVVIFDEAHKLKRIRDSAVARRVSRYLAEFPQTKCCILTGTISKDSLKDYAHMLVWALRANAPIPTDPDRVDFWAACLDHKSEKRPDSSALCAELGVRSVNLDSLRMAYRDRLRDTPGCVISSSAYADSGLTLRPYDVPVPDSLNGAFTDLRSTFTCPDGWLLLDERFEVWHVARQLALGFYYRHDPRPPEPWFMARRHWGKFVREVLEVSEKYDTQLQVSMGVESGALPEETYRAWQAIQPSFVPNTVCEWLSDHALKACEAWARGYGEKGGIIWIDHIEFGREVARRTGWKLYTEGGLSADGAYIGNAKATDIVIASRMACATGHNLQQWSRNLVTAPPNGGVDWEQMIGRTHRTGQKAGVVEFWYFNSGLEFARSVENALAESKYVQHTTGAQQRLNLADVVPPIQGSGPAWGID